MDFLVCASVYTQPLLSSGEVRPNPQNSVRYALIGAIKYLAKAIY